VKQLDNPLNTPLTEIEQMELFELQEDLKSHKKPLTEKFQQELKEKILLHRSKNQAKLKSENKISRQLKKKPQKTHHYILSSFQKFVATVAAVFLLGTVGTMANENLRNSLLDQFDPKGSLKVITDPVDEPAHVYIDTLYQGETPIEIKRIKIGKHTLKVVKEKYKEYLQEFIIENKKSATVTISFEATDSYKEQGQSIKILLEPEEKTITNTGNPSTTTPQNQNNTSVGNAPEKCASISNPNTKSVKQVCIVDKNKHLIHYNDSGYALDAAPESPEYWQEKFDEEIWVKNDQGKWNKLKETKDSKCSENSAHYCKTQKTDNILWSPSGNNVAFIIRNGEREQRITNDQVFSYSFIDNKLNEIPHFANQSPTLSVFSPDEKYILADDSVACCGTTMEKIGLIDIHLSAFNELFSPNLQNNQCFSSIKEGTFTSNTSIEAKVENCGEKNQLPLVIRKNEFSLKIIEKN